jgi:hypothetical protein
MGAAKIAIDRSAIPARGKARSVGRWLDRRITFAHRMKLLHAAVAAFLLVIAGPSYAQQSIRDTTIIMVPVTASYSYQVPGGHLAERFGQNSNVGLCAYVKLRSNYLIGAEGSFLFGRKVIETGLLSGLANSYGQILDQDGQPAQVLLFERGYTLMAVLGKIIPIVGPNPNSGLMLKLNLGYLRHKIRIETQVDEVPQLEGDYLQGYDRLTGGPAFGLSVGYQHFGNKRFVNFYFGFEALYAFTQPLRAVNFDTGKSDADTRVDQLTGLRAGWTIPIYRRKATGFYSY